MNRWGCLGLFLGGLAGLLLVVLLLILVQPATPVIAVPAIPISSDATVFLSERAVSQFVSEARQSPAAVDFEVGGQMKVTTRLETGGLKPVVELGLSLEMQGSEVVSRLHWVQMGWLKIPAHWLPPEIIETGTLPGQMITQSLPPYATLVGLTTMADGINFQVNLTGIVP